MGPTPLSIKQANSFPGSCIGVWFHRQVFAMCLWVALLPFKTSTWSFNCVIPPHPFLPVPSPSCCSPFAGVCVSHQVGLCLPVRADGLRRHGWVHRAERSQAELQVWAIARDPANPGMGSTLGCSRHGQKGINEVQKGKTEKVKCHPFLLPDGLSYLAFVKWVALFWQLMSMEFWSMAGGLFMYYIYIFI